MINTSNFQLEKLIKETAMLLKKEDITESSTLLEMGIDSLNVIELILICQSIFPNSKNPELLKLDEYTTLKDLYEQLVTLSE